MANTSGMQKSVTENKAHQAPTGVQPVEAEDTHSAAGKEHQKQALKLNVEGDAAQAQRHPDTPAGQHATGSFTGNADESEKEARSDRPHRK